MKLKTTALILLLVFCFPIGFTENVSSVNAQTRRNSRRPARLIIHRNSGKTRTAVCRDGSISLSRNRRGTCSRHGGVRRWLR